MTWAGREAPSAAAPSRASCPQPVDRVVERVGTGRRVAVRSGGTGRGRAGTPAPRFSLPPAGMWAHGGWVPHVGGGGVTREGGGHVPPPCDVPPLGGVQPAPARPRG